MSSAGTRPTVGGAGAGGLVTADELLAMGDIGRCELVNGEIVMMAPAGDPHGTIAGEIHGLLYVFVRSRGLGRVLSAESGFLLSRDPDTVRAADVAVVSEGRLRQSRGRGYYTVTPELVVEVVSPGDTAAEVAEKVREWLAAGVTSVWVVEPVTQTIVVHHHAQQPMQYRTGDVVVDEVALPGFSLAVAEVFRPVG